VAAALSAVTVTPPASATVPITQVATIKGQKPVSGTYDAGYTSYGEKVCVNPRACSKNYYRVARGTLQTKLNSYVIKDGIKRFDFYLLSVDTALAGQSGSSALGAATLQVRTISGKIVDTDDSKSIKKEPKKCTAYPVTVGAGWGVASGGIEVGAITLCNDRLGGARVQRRGRGLHRRRAAEDQAPDAEPDREGQGGVAAEVPGDRDLPDRRLHPHRPGGHRHRGQVHPLRGPHLDDHLHGRHQGLTGAALDRPHVWSLATVSP